MIKLIRKTATIVAILSPLLNMYGLTEQLHTFTYREVFFIIVILLVILTMFAFKTIKTNSNYSLLLYIFAIIISLSFNIFMDEYSSILRTLRYLLILLFIYSVAQNFFDKELAIKTYKYMVLFAAIFLIFQAISANLFNYELKGYISFLPLRSLDLGQSNGLVRFYSIFEEPGYFGMISSAYLLIVLLENKTNIIEVFIITLASLLSTANTSIVLVVFVFTQFAVNKLHIIKIKLSLANIVKSSVVIVVLVTTVILFIMSPQYETVMSRIDLGISVERRFTGYFDFVSTFSEHNLIQKVVGNSMEVYPIGGYAALILSFGILGASTFAIFLTDIFIKTNIIGKNIIILFLFINIANVEIFGNASTIIIQILFVFTYIQENNYRKVIKHEIYNRIR